MGSGIVHWWGNFYQNCDDDGICCGAVLLLNICHEKCSYKQKIYGTLTHIDGNDDSDDDVNDVHMVNTQQQHPPTLSRGYILCQLIRTTFIITVGITFIISKSIKFLSHLHFQPS